MDVHHGHRERMRLKFAEHGGDIFKEHELLELLLFYSIPVRDTNIMAHRLLDRFGSLVNVLDAPIDELVKTEGIGESSAVLIKLTAAFNKAYHSGKRVKNLQLNSAQKAGSYAVTLYTGEVNEIFYVLCLNNANRLLFTAKLSSGSVNKAEIHYRKLVETVLRHNSSAVILVHNHPAGMMEPSEADIEATANIASVLKRLDIRILDHIIVADGRYISMKEEGYI